MVMEVLGGQKTFEEAKIHREEDHQAVEIYRSGKKQSIPSEQSTPSRDMDSKMKAEWDKIRMLEAKIGQVNKA